jgi:hypothetical protein
VECAERLDIVAGKRRRPNDIAVTENSCADRDTRTLESRQFKQCHGGSWGLRAAKTESVGSKCEGCFDKNSRI